MDWYSTPEGKRVYSDKPSAQGAEDSTGTAAHPKTSGTPDGEFVGIWKRRDLHYHLISDGSLLCEKRRTGQVLIWRTGTWSNDGNKIKFHFTRYGTAAGSASEGEVMDYVETGEYMRTGPNSFAARIGGLDGEWWDTFVRLGEER